MIAHLFVKEDSNIKAFTKKILPFMISFLFLLFESYITIFIWSFLLPVCNKIISNYKLGGKYGIKCC